MSEHTTRSTIGRRAFLATTAGAVAIINPARVRGTQANGSIALGIIGCGGRGHWIAEHFVKHGGYRFVACADYYPDQVDRFGEKYGVDSSRRFTTLSAYKRLLETELDAVVIESPPYFHPEQAAAAVDAGRHVYLAKPIAIDVPGCRSIAAGGRKATDRNQVFLVDFQTRNNELYREAVKRVHAGEIGKMICADAHYPWSGGRMPAPESPEDRLRRWYCTKALSGDFINEQSIHSLDVATWFADADPISVTGTGGSKGLRAYGDIWDHFNLTFTFPNNFVVTFSCIQTCPGAPNEISCRVYGSRGFVDTNYFGYVRFESTSEFKGGSFSHLYTTGCVNNIRDFHQAILNQDYENATVTPSVRSNLACVFGRDAAYSGKPMIWSELMKSDTRLEPDLTGLKA